MTQSFIDIYQNIANSDIDESLFEASSFRNPILKEIDGEFLKLKNTKLVKDQRPIKKQLQILIRKFTGSKHVFVNIKKDLNNAYVIPIYNGMFYKKVKQDIKSINERGIEGSQYIDRIYITFGQKLINKLSHTQLTAVLLHELGHAFLHKSHIMIFVNSIIKSSHAIIVLISMKYFLNYFLIPIIPYLIIVRTIGFLDHKEEYNADKFAAKYGYADDIADVMLMFHNINVKNKSKIRRIFDSIISFILPTSHPLSKNRLKKLHNHYMKKYQQIYPDIKNELTIIFNSLENK